MLVSSIINSWKRHVLHSIFVKMLYVNCLCNSFFLLAVLFFHDVFNEKIQTAEEPRLFSLLSFSLLILLWCLSLNRCLSFIVICTNNFNVLFLFPPKICPSASTGPAKLPLLNSSAFPHLSYAVSRGPLHPHTLPPHMLLNAPHHCSHPCVSPLSVLPTHGLRVI